jgi:UDP-N-acetylglucosamine 2-epimerase (non-hydrolysing)/GDP/UDP-N,N'-diacetylbacillosamine 2-epimerase (hydrolysing)
MAQRRIGVVTGTRADYGLLYGLLREVQADPELRLQLVVTGMHLSPQFGGTVQEIEDDGFEIDARVEMLVSSDTGVGTAKSMGLGLSGMADALDRLAPDVLVVLGDRFEMWAAAQAALVLRVPTAHIHGGETTEGAFDESIRHALTKMAHYHFVVAEPYRRRVVQMGEAPDRVFTVGAPGLDQIQYTDLLDREAFEASIGFELGTPTFLVTYHPATLGDTDPADGVRELLRALDRFDDARLLFTKANADPQGRRINEALEAYCEGRDDAQVYASLGQRRYLSALRHVDVVVGNSSSGLIEAPAFDVPTVNVGPRQRGRLRGPSVIDCAEEADAIADAIRTACSAAFRTKMEGAESPYGAGDTAETITRHLKRLPLDDSVLTKPFYDLDGGLDDLPAP